MKLRTITLLFAMMMVTAGLYAQTTYQMMNMTELSEEDQDAAEKVVKAYFDAIAEEDIEGVAATLHEEYEMRLSWQEETVSRDERIASWKSNFESMSDMSIMIAMGSLTMTPDAEDGESSTMVMTMFRPTFSDGESGAELSTMIRTDFEVKDGKIIAEWPFYDRKHMMDQAAEGGEEEAGDGEE